MVTEQSLIERANKIDLRLGPIPGRDADAIALELREAARLIASLAKALNDIRAIYRNGPRNVMAWHGVNDIAFDALAPALAVRP